MLPREKIQRQFQDPHGYDQQMQQRLKAIPDNEPRRYMEGSYADASLDLVNASTNPKPPTSVPVVSGDISLPTQLKVMIHFDPSPSHVTIVVSSGIKCQSLIDRIDSKMHRVSSCSIGQGSARLSYKDSDDDMVAIKVDEDVQMALEDWAECHAEQLRNANGSNAPDFSLYWQELK